MAAGDKHSTKAGLLAIELNPATNGNAHGVQAFVLTDSAGVEIAALPGARSTVVDVTSSAVVAAAAAVATLPGVAAKTTYISGFTITGLGATAAVGVTAVVSGTISGSLNYVIAVPAGVTAGIAPLVVQLPRPIPASAVNTAIVVTVPSFGAGNTSAAVSAHGFQV